MTKVHASRSINRNTPLGSNLITFSPMTIMIKMNVSLMYNVYEGNCMRVDA